MNQRELEKIQKKSIYSMQINAEMRDSAINGHLNDLNKVVKREVKKRNLRIFLIEE